MVATPADVAFACNTKAYLHKHVHGGFAQGVPDIVTLPEEQLTTNCPAKVGKNLAAFFREAYKAPSNQPLQATKPCKSNMWACMQAPISSKEVQQAIQHLKQHTLPGPDGVTAPMLKEAEEALTPLLTALFQAVYSTHHMLDAWHEYHATSQECCRPGR